jgi:hypothetical protein
MSALKFLVRSFGPLLTQSLTAGAAGDVPASRQIENAAAAELPLRQPSNTSSGREKTSHQVAPATPRIALKGLL